MQRRKAYVTSKEMNKKCKGKKERNYLNSKRKERKK